MLEDTSGSTWSEDVGTVLKSLSVDPGCGLHGSEVLRRRQSVGPNQLQLAQPRHLLSILAAQLRSVVVVLLVIAGVLALWFSGIPETLAIVAVIVINTTIGFLSELHATRSMEALRQFARVTCVVLRDNSVRQVAAEELVPGDIVLFDAGDLVPADLRLLEGDKLSVNESLLTGESLPVRKYPGSVPPETSLLDRSNILFSGTAITRGSGRGVVVETGMRTEFGKIFRQASEAKTPRTPLEKRLDSLGRRLAWAVIIIGVLIAAGGILAGRDAFLAIQVAIALAVAAIPEGLPIVATIALARGMWRMAQRQALVTRLSAVETLGATSIILTDKTGTLTESRMTATTALLPDADVSLDQPGTENSVGLLRGLLTTGSLCNNASLPQGAVSGSGAVGDPTEVALLAAASQYGIRRERLVEQCPEVHEDAFDPDSKRMATVHRCDGHYLVAAKGAPETLLACCDAVHTDHGSVPLGENERARWLRRVESLCQRGLRTIAVADKTVDSSPGEPYSDLVLWGVLGLEDPPREEVDAAIRQCRAAGVRVVMATGDHAATARHIADAVGITDELAEGRQHFDGNTVEHLLGHSKTEELLQARVFSRVTPEQKLKLIDLYQHEDHIVAMTGDGVNDAPALKQADIGIAMGIRGTAVAREAAAMVLQDDNFASIVAAIGQGRIIFANIRKFVIYLLSCNTSEIFIISLATIAGAPLPLLPLQILFLNLVTDVFPALALGIGPGDGGLMNRGPRPASERILMRRHWIQIGIYGIVIALSVLLVMSISVNALGYEHEKAVSVAFLTLAFAQLWHVFNMRKDMKRVVNNEIVSNVWVWLALVLCLALIFAALFVPPMANVLQLSKPDVVAWQLVLVGSFIPLAAAPLVRTVASMVGNSDARPAI